MQKTKKGLTNKKSCDIIFKSSERSTQPIFSRGIFPSRDEYDNIVGNADSYMALWPSGKAKVCNTSIPGSIPGGASNKKRTFVYQKFSFCLSKPQAWHIIGARSATYIIKGGKPSLYLITRQRVSSCGLMIYKPSF